MLFLFLSLFLYQSANLSAQDSNFYLKQSLSNTPDFQSFIRNKEVSELINNHSTDCYKRKRFQIKSPDFLDINFKQDSTEKFFKYTFKVNGAVFEGTDQFGRPTRFLLNFSKEDGLFLSSDTAAFMLNTGLDQQRINCGAQLSTAEKAQRELCEKIPDPKVNCERLKKNSDRKHCADNRKRYQSCKEKKKKIRKKTKDECETNNRTVIGFEQEKREIIAASLGFSEDFREVLDQEETNPDKVNVAFAFDLDGEGSFDLGSARVLSDTSFSVKENGAISYKLDFKSCTFGPCISLTEKITHKKGKNKNQLTGTIKTGGKNSVLALSVSSTIEDGQPNRLGATLSGGIENGTFIFTGFLNVNSTSGQRGLETQMGGYGVHKPTGTGFIVRRNQDLDEENSNTIDSLSISRKVSKNLTASTKAYTEENGPNGDRYSAVRFLLSGTLK